MERHNPAETNHSTEDEILIAEVNASDSVGDPYQDWLVEHNLDRDDNRLAGLRVHLHHAESSDQYTKRYYLPRSAWRSLLKQDAPPSARRSAPKADQSPSSFKSAPLDLAAVARWVEAVVTPWTGEFREAVAADDRLEQIRVWNRIDGLRRLVEALCTAEDLAWLDRSLYQNGVAANEPTVAPPGDSVIDLRDRPPPVIRIPQEATQPSVESEDSASDSAAPGLISAKKRRTRNLFRY